MIIKEEKIEEILAVNWTQFIDVSLLRNFVNEKIQSNLNNLSIIPMKVSIKGNSISLSRFYFKNDGYYFWVEFNNLVQKHMAEGTMELYVPFENNHMKMTSIIGNLYPISDNV